MKKQYLFAIILLLSGLIVFIVLNYIAKNQKSIKEKTKETLSCIKNCYDEYAEAEKNIPEGWSPEFTKIQADFESCKDNCDKITNQ